MSIDLERARKRLKDFDFTKLFIDELGWDCHSAVLDVPVNGETFSLVAVAQKRGMVAFVCAGCKGRIPEYSIRRKIDTQVAKSAREHLTIYTDGAKTTQVWQWVKREPGKPSACREHSYHCGQPGDALIQKLQSVAFGLEEEAALTLVDVTSRVRAGFDIEKVTKRFYEFFKAEHAAFLKFLDGIPDKGMERWYVSVMLNRLMFIYFVQKKGFLDGDQNYLRSKLAASKARGKDKFYLDFLCPLFFEGFAQKESDRSAAVNKLLGKVPYLNGGLFLKHQIEQLHGRAIDIADTAFERLFDFFDRYHWHLDERPLRKDNEINPDVLGYIFEKYINQKQMGAYYTKEDITGYISRNTIIPFLFDAVKRECKIAFEGEQSIWRLLAADPDRYIYPAVRRGVIDDKGQLVPESALPEFVRKGMNDPKARMFNRDYNLGRAVIPGPDGANLALPTETWREYVERRKRCLELRAKLGRGEVREINDLITLNLDIEQFAQDVIENCEGPELLRAFWHAILQVTVLDSTCGSGAFVFAALNILESLYEACLDRMEVFLDELDRSGEKHRLEKFADFRKVLDRVAKHPNRKYFIYKSIVVNNLYGVDIMEEAVEICKLRLFLKLVAQIDRPDQIEPLPDIDFNIRAGNTLVGYANLDQFRKVAMRKLDGEAVVTEVEAKAQNVDRLASLFRQQQTELGGTVTAADKQALRDRLGELESELNRYLATDYAIEPMKKPAYAAWIKSHQPFHWFVEFYGIMKLGGFDIVIGNPPYKELRAVTEYQLRGLATVETKNLYPPVMERCLQFSFSGGRLGFIVPVSSISTEGYKRLQDILFQYTGHFSSYDDRPSRLFDGLEHIQLTIHLLQHRPTTQPQQSASECYRWSSEERPHLFGRIEYEQVERDYLPGCLAKLSRQLEHSVLRKLWADRIALGEQQAATGQHIAYYSRKVHNFLQALDFVPQVYDGRGKLRPPSELKELTFTSPAQAALAFCALNSSLFRWFINVFSDCRHVNKREVERFRLDMTRALERRDSVWLGLARKLSARLKDTAEFRNMRFAHDDLRVQCIIPRHAKPVIDEIDCVLAEHYGFTGDELDFIVNYDIKYRLGADTEDGDE